MVMGSRRRSASAPAANPSIRRRLIPRPITTPPPRRIPIRAPSARPHLAPTPSNDPLEGGSCCALILASSQSFQREPDGASVAFPDSRFADTGTAGGGLSLAGTSGRPRRVVSESVSGIPRERRPPGRLCDCVVDPRRPAAGRAVRAPQATRARRSRLRPAATQPPCRGLTLSGAAHRGRWSRVRRLLRSGVAAGVGAASWPRRPRERRWRGRGRSATPRSRAVWCRMRC